MRLPTLLAPTLLALVAVVLPTAALAEADGPDHFRVEIEGEGAIISLYPGPSATARPIASIPDGTDGLVNRRCQGGLSLPEWEAASEIEREAAAARRWCEVGYGSIHGWVHAIHLREGTALPSARSPSFRCVQASSSAEFAVCRHDRLAAFDVELARLYALAQAGGDMTEEGRSTLTAMQRGWAKGRDECWKAGAGILDCVALSYLTRIAEIRAEYPAARSADEAGISTGPLSYTCGTIEGPVAATFVAVPQPAALVRLGEEVLAMTIVEAASGARYETPGGDSFWTKGDRALVQRAADRPRACFRETTD
ncbi:MAG: MliC family protein [Pseudomonadota bacterium]